MVFGIQMYGVLAKQAAPVEEVLKTIKRVGIDGIEPCINFDEDYDDSNPSFWSTKKFDDLYPLINEVGLAVVTVFVGAKSLVDSADRMCEMAKKYDIPYFILGMPADLTKEVIEQTAVTYRKLARLLEPYGARILIHNGKPDTEVVIEDMTAYEYMIKVCDGSVGMEFDTGWGAAGGINPIELLENNDDAVEALHFKDFVNPKESDNDIYIGGGSVDNKTAMKIGIDKKIPLFIDQDNYEDLETDMRKSYEYLMGEIN